MFSEPTWDDEPDDGAKKKKHIKPSYVADAFINSPSASKPLLEESSFVDGTAATKKKKNRKKKNKENKGAPNPKPLAGVTKKTTFKSGSLLKQGLKFAGLDDFCKYVSVVKQKQHKSKNNAAEPKPELTGLDGPCNGEDDSPAKRSTIETTAKTANSNEIRPVFDPKKLQDALNKSIKVRNVKVSTPSKAMLQLQSSRFRYLNELLYTQTGSQSLKMFNKDPEAFSVYHQGYQEQLAKWPSDPLEEIIVAIMKRSDEPVIADFGCGEARLARSLTNLKVHSFDLVALNDRVTVCDVASTPLENESVDIVVFCLSLMGTNLRDYLKEANRVLKLNGIVKIAEVESRFAEVSVDNFVEIAVKLGFVLKWKNLAKGYFVFMDLKKVGTAKKKVPEIGLKPCLYKKR